MSMCPEGCGVDCAQFEQAPSVHEKVTEVLSYGLDGIQQAVFSGLLETRELKL